MIVRTQLLHKPEYGPEAPKTIGEHPRVVLGTGPPHIQCLSCGLRAAHANGYPRWASLRGRGVGTPPPGEAAAPAAPTRNYAGGGAPAALVGASLSWIGPAALRSLNAAVVRCILRGPNWGLFLYQRVPH